MARTGKLTSLVTDEDIKLRQRRSLSTETADKLRELILLEKLPPGMHIPERDLSEALGISRTPMREALRILEAEGLVDRANVVVDRLWNARDGDFQLPLPHLGRARRCIPPRWNLPREGCP